MLERKGIHYKRVDLMPVISKGALRAVGFPGITVPALKIDGRKIQGSREIARELDRLRPEPPLFPADPERRARGRGGRAWGDEAPATDRPPDPLERAAPRPIGARSYSEGARLGVPVGLAVKTGQPIVALSARLNEATDENVRADLAALPGTLQRIDDWIADGVLGGEQPNAADLQIATSVRLLMTLQDLRAAIASRPAGELAMRLAPEYPGDAPPILPAAWLEPLRATAPRPRGRASERAERGSTRSAVTEPPQRLGEPGPVGQRELGVELQQRHEHEAPRRSPAGGAASAARVSSSRSPSSSRSTSSGRGPCRGPPNTLPRSTSIALHASSSSSGSSSVADSDDGVEEVRLVEDLADRLGLVRARSSTAPSDRSTAVQAVEQLADVGPQVAKRDRRRSSRAPR